MEGSNCQFIKSSLQVRGEYSIAVLNRLFLIQLNKEVIKTWEISNKN